MIYNDTIYTNTKRLGILGINSNTEEGDGASKSAVYQARPVLAFLTCAAPSLKPCPMPLHARFSVCLSSPRVPARAARTSAAPPTSPAPRPRLPWAGRRPPWLGATAPCCPCAGNEGPTSNGEEGTQREVSK